MDQVWFITGAGKGMGKALALAALREKNKVVITTHKDVAPYTLPEDSDNVLYVTLDVAAPDERLYCEAVTAAVRKFGRIDVLVNNAGHGRITNFEETSEENIRELFEVNLFGMMRVTRAVLPVMRKQKSGHIFNVSSGAGYSAGPAAYHTSKFAVTGFSTCLAFELAPFHIKVTNVVPGLTRTEFYGRERLPSEPDIPIADYDFCRWQKEFIRLNSNHEQPGNPDKIARLILAAAESKNPPLHLPVTADAVAVLDDLCGKLRSDTDAWREAAFATAYEEPK